MSPTNEEAVWVNKAIGQRIHEVARGYTQGGISGFQRALVEAGVRGVSGRKELYAKFSGDSGISPELVGATATILRVRREWLERGELPRYQDEVSNDSRERRRRGVLLQRALEKAFQSPDPEQVKSAARAIARDSLYLTAESGYDDEQAALFRERMVECIADLFNASPRLRDPIVLTSCVDRAISLYADFSMLIVDTNPQYGEYFRKGAWAVVWSMIKYTAAGAYPETWWMAYRSLNSVTFQLKRGEEQVVDATGRSITSDTKEQHATT